MSTGTWVIVGLVAAVLLAIFVAGVRVGSKLPPTSPLRRTRSRPPRPGEKGYEPTAVYLPHDRHGQLLYVGISNRPQLRAEQHAADKAWSREVASVRGWTFNDRYCALAVEEAFIDYLRPPHNTSPSGSSDAWTEPRPPIRRLHLRWPGQLEARARGVLRRAS